MTNSSPCYAASAGFTRCTVEKPFPTILAVLRTDCPAAFSQMRLAARSCASLSGLSGLAGAVLARSLVLCLGEKFIERNDRIILV